MRVINRLQELIIEKLATGKKQHEIAREAGVSKVSISTYYHKGVTPDATNLAKLAKYFGVQPFELLEPRAFAEERRSNTVARELIKVIPTLPEDIQKRLLEEVATKKEEPK